MGRTRKSRWTKNRHTRANCGAHSRRSGELAGEGPYQKGRWPGSCDQRLLHSLVLLLELGQHPIR